MNTFVKVLALIALIAFVIFLIGIGPVLTILSLNALFNTGIAITLGNWFATLWIMIVFGASKIKYNR